MATSHGFCTLHRIAYNGDLDPTCPQCMIGHVAGQQQLDYDIVRQAPLDAAGVLLDKRTLLPVK